MKNLKKVLALALAVIMMMSLFTVAFAAETETKLVASDFTDYAEIEYKDAVALCVDLGIISGIANGDGTYKFAPKDSIDRASWAKLVYFIATGDDNADAYKGANVGMTDISTSWAEGYIAYCVANGFAAGDGLGHYLPANTTTVAAGLKTLLNILGWDPDDRGYQGTLTWTGSVMTDAKANGLMKNVASANTANVTLTREVAAQIIYNALNAQTVEPKWGRDNGEKYVSSYDKNQGLLCAKKFSIMPITATVDEVNADGTGIFSIADSNNVQGAITGLDNVVKASATLAGENVTIFVKIDSIADMNFTKVVSTAAVKSADAATATFTGGVAAADLTDSTKDDYVAATYASGAVYYLDGSKYKTDGGAPNALNDLATDAANAGNKVEVFTNSNGEISMVKVTTYKVDKVTDEVTLKTKSDKKTYVTIPGVLTSTEVSLVEGYQGLEKGDIVLIHKAKNGTYSIQKAEKVTGSVTKVTSGATPKATLNGTAYAASGITSLINTTANSDGNLNLTTWASNVKAWKDNVYDFYLDINGTVCYSVLVEGETETEVAYVLETDWVAGSGIASSNYAEAKLLFTDGTTEIVRVNSVKARTDAKVQTIVGDNADPGADEVKYTNGFVAKLTASKNFVKYSVNSDGYYNLITMDSTADADKDVAGDETTNMGIQQKALFTHNGGTSGIVKANNKTVFIVDKHDTTEKTHDYSVYTGFANVPEMIATDINFISNNGFVTYVYLHTTSGFTSDGTSGFIYVLDKDAVTDTTGNTVYQIVNENGDLDEMALNTATADKFYKISTVDDNGKGTTASAVATAIETSDKTTDPTNFTCGGSVVTVGSKTVAYDDDTVAVLIIKDANGEYEVNTVSLDSFKVDATTYSYNFALIAGSDDVADFVYILATEASTAPSVNLDV